MGVIRWPRS